MGNKRLTDRQFAESTHRYTDPRTGERVTSVTSVVGTFDSGDKLAAGAGAAIKLERAGLDYRQEWDKKRDTGTRVHEYLDLWLNGKMADVRADDDLHMDSFVAWCKTTQPEWLMTERAGVGSVECPAGPCGVCKGIGRLGFGGRFDGIGLWDDTYYLGDFKSGRAYRPELTIQLAGYANFDGLIVYDEEGKAVDLEPLPHIDRWCGIYVRAEGVEVFECPDPAKEADDWTIEQMQAEAFQVFTSLLFTKEWAKQIARKGR
jgi:hypothetical protein